MKSNARWVKRFVANGNPIFYDRHTGKIIRELNIGDVIGGDDVWSNLNFSPQAPLKVYFDMSYRCNFRCLHCLTSSHPNYDISKELSTGRILDLVEELAKIGVLEIAIGGGEPFYYEHCLEVFQSIARNKINLIITTNGSLVSEQLVATLSAVEPLDVRVSFDGGPQLHDLIRGKGTYKKAIIGLSKLITGHISSTARLTLSRGGDDEIPTLFDDLANIGTRKVKVALTKFIGRATDQGKHLVRDIESIEISEWLIKLGLQNGVIVELSSEDFKSSSIPIVDSKLRVSAPHCGAGFETAYISATGQVTACVAMPSQSFGELHKKTFAEVWLGDLAVMYRDWAANCKTQRICDACNKKCK